MYFSVQFNVFDRLKSSGGTYLQALVPRVIYNL